MCDPPLRTSQARYPDVTVGGHSKVLQTKPRTKRHMRLWLIGHISQQSIGNLKGEPDRLSAKRQEAAQSLDVRFSNRPVWVKRLQTIHHYRVRCRSRARASLRNRHQGPSIMGFEDEAEQSLPRPWRQDVRSKRTCELTSSIVPRGTSCHRWGGARVSSYRIRSSTVVMLLRLDRGSSGTQCRQPRCGA